MNNKRISDLFYDESAFNAKKKQKKNELALKHSGHMSKMKFNQHLQEETEIGK